MATDLLAETMTAAGEKECKLAIEEGDYHQGIPAITVVVDQSVRISTPTMPRVA